MLLPRNVFTEFGLIKRQSYRWSTAHNGLWAIFPLDTRDTLRYIFIDRLKLYGFRLDKLNNMTQQSNKAG